MVIFQDSHRFELTVEAGDGDWVARLYEWVPGRLQSTVHLLRSFEARADAIEALGRKWQILFPQAEPLDWREAVIQSSPPPSRSRRRPTPTPRDI